MDDPLKTSAQELMIPKKYKTPAPPRERSLLVEVNSRDRNLRSYPKPGQFRWRFQRPMKDVKSIQLVGGTIPTRIYNINTGWNKFTFLQASVLYTVSLTPGRYTMTTLASELQTQLNAIAPMGGNQYTAIFSSITDQLQVTRTSGSDPFAFLFSSGVYVDQYDINSVLIMMNSPAQILGFLTADYTNGSGSVITSPNPAQVDFLMSRVYLHINGDNAQDIHTIERSVGRDGPFCIIYMDENDKSYKFFDKLTFVPVYLSAPASISRMTTLDISLRDEFNRVINLNGRDFTLLLELVVSEELI
jgi:hypothetical protein